MSSSNKHLLLDSTIFDLQPDGGISRYWFELASNLARRHQDWNITLLADRLTPNKFGRKLLHVTQGAPNVRVHHYTPRQIGRLYGPRLTDEYKHYVWHSSYYRVPTRPNLTAVCTVYDFIYERYASGLQARLHTWKKRKAIFGAAEIVCISEATKRELCALYPDIPAGKCHVTLLGPSASFFPAAARGQAVAPQTSPYVLFVGSRGAYKNFRLAVLALEAVPDHELYIVGGGRLSKAETDMLSSRLPNRYRVFEVPSDEVLRDLYQGAVALAYLSRCEGFGFPPLEAMACGCPVIAMNASSIPEVVGDAAILLSGEDALAVSAAIRAVAEPERRRALIDKGIERAALFSWDKTVDETVAVYERALSR